MAKTAQITLTGGEGAERRQYAPGEALPADVVKAAEKMGIAITDVPDAPKGEAKPDDDADAKAAAAAAKAEAEAAAKAAAEAKAKTKK